MSARTTRWSSLVALGVLCVVRLASAAGVNPTRISLPKGPGSIEGLGRSFVPSLASGTALDGTKLKDW